MLVVQIKIVIFRSQLEYSRQNIIAVRFQAGLRSRFRTIVEAVDNDLSFDILYGQEIRRPCFGIRAGISDRGGKAVIADFFNPECELQRNIFCLRRISGSVHACADICGFRCTGRSEISNRIGSSDSVFNDLKAAALASAYKERKSVGLLCIEKFIVGRIKILKITAEYRFLKIHCCGERRDCRQGRKHHNGQQTRNKLFHFCNSFSF